VEVPYLAGDDAKEWAVEFFGILVLVSAIASFSRYGKSSRQ
jgi:hypothetical protein